MSSSTLLKDPDMQAEAAKFDHALRLGGKEVRVEVPISVVPDKNWFVPLYVSDGTYQTSKETAQLLKEIGGSSAVRRMTNIFYQKCFEDPHVDQFIISHADPHFSRLADWIVEKMGGEGDVWTQERVQRSKCPVMRTLSNGAVHTVRDRTSAHVAAWWSPKRNPRDAGQHFCVHDCRVWMRLMFWSAREAGAFEHPAFADWCVSVSPRACLCPCL